MKASYVITFIAGVCLGAWLVSAWLRRTDGGDYRDTNGISYGRLNEK